MIITIDCNQDTLTIRELGSEDFEYDVPRPKELSKILEEIFNRIEVGFGGAHESIDVELVLIDEDTVTTIGEW